MKKKRDEFSPPSFPFPASIAPWLALQHLSSESPVGIHHIPHPGKTFGWKNWLRVCKVGCAFGRTPPESVPHSFDIYGVKKDGRRANRRNKNGEESNEQKKWEEKLNETVHT